ncbi:MAG: GLUG motif-containing protein, partial [Candidatus Marinimicrobia bacterium]|nr:GLUG motif-containing protein [Candidatus Neomarinimicrobiota bacterium]
MRKLIIFIATLLMSVTMIFAGTYSGGDGTSVNPYQINDLEDLLELSDSTGDWDSYFIQTADINAGATSGWNSDVGFSPIGNASTYFTGKYNGQGHTIDSLFIDRPNTNSIGLFGRTDGATIDSIVLTSVDFTGDRYTGGLIGFNYNSSTISNSYSTGSVSGDDYVGGLIGYNYYSSTVSNSYSTGSVSGDNYVGGLVGSNNNSSTVSNSYSTGSVSGATYVGSLVGKNYSSTITNSYSTGSLSGTNRYAGGLVGMNTSTSTVINSYSMGDVTRSSGNYTYFGGFIGWNYNSAIEDCYSTGSVYYTGATDPTDKGFVAYNDGGTYNDNFFDNEASNQSTDAVGSATAKTTAEMKCVFTYTDTSYIVSAGLDSAWDFVSNPNDDVNNDDYWDMDQLGTVNSGYPILSWQSGSDNEILKGAGTTGAPYQISDICELAFLSNNSSYWDKYFIQTLDIIAGETSGWNSGGGFSSIGNATIKFTGEYNGEGHTIDSLYINRSSTSNIGLFGIALGAVVDSIGLTSVNITGGNEVGGLVGYNVSSIVSNSISTGTVSGTSRVGGLVGYNRSSSISNSYSTGSVSAVSYVGGLVGKNYSSTVSNSYSMGDVSRSSGTNTNFGGFAGWNESSIIEYSYSTGYVYYTDEDPTDKGF